MYNGFFLIVMWNNLHKVRVGGVFLWAAPTFSSTGRTQGYAVFFAFPWTALTISSSGSSWTLFVANGCCLCYINGITKWRWMITGRPRSERLGPGRISNTCRISGIEVTIIRMVIAIRIWRILDWTIRHLPKFHSTANARQARVTRMKPYPKNLLDHKLN